MFNKLALILLLITGNQEALIKRSNGVWFTGKGCGITNEIKFLAELPKEDHEEKDLSCTFISKAYSPPTETCKDWFDFWFYVYLLSLVDTCTHVYAYDIKTNEARKIRQIDSLSDCIKECKKESKCKAFTYATKKAQNRFLRKTCWLKLGTIEAKEHSVDEEIVSGMINCAKHPDLPEDAIRYDGPQT